MRRPTRELAESGRQLIARSAPRQTSVRAAVGPVVLGFAIGLISGVLTYWPPDSAPVRLVLFGLLLLGVARLRRRHL